MANWMLPVWALKYRHLVGPLPSLSLQASQARRAGRQAARKWPEPKLSCKFRSRENPAGRDIHNEGVWQLVPACTQTNSSQSVLTISLFVSTKYWLMHVKKANININLAAHNSMWMGKSYLKLHFFPVFYVIC
jgi:hypothetical protein